MILEYHNFKFRGTNQPSTHLRKDCWIDVNLKATVKCENYEIKSLNFRVKSISRSPIADIGPRDPTWARIIHSFS